MALFSDSLGFFTSIALGFVPKDPNWSGNGPKQNFQKTLKTCLTSAQFYSKLVFFVCLILFLVVSSDSLAFSASIPLFSVPKYPLGADFGLKQNSKKLENLSNTRSGNVEGNDQKFHYVSLVISTFPKRLLDQVSRCFFRLCA